MADCGERLPDAALASCAGVRSSWARTGNKPITHIAADLGITSSFLRRWMNKTTSTADVEDG
jgi:hypothetical protein